MALDTFLRAKRDAGHADDLSQGVHVNDWRPAFYAAHTGDTPHSKKVAFQRARNALVAAGDLSCFEDIYRLARLPDADC